MGNKSSNSKQKKNQDQKTPTDDPYPQQQQVPQQDIRQLVNLPLKINSLYYTQEECLKLEQLVEVMEQQFQEEQQLPQKQQLIEDVDAKLGEQLENLKFRLIPRTHSLKPSDQPQLLPVVLQIEALKSQEKTDKTEKTKEKAAIDLVCVVDISGSMEGKKLSLVKDSLRYIMKILGPQDRICLVTFDTISQINLPWTKNTADNKELIKSSILKMVTKGSTNIAAGVQQGLWMMKSRKTKNPVTCMFLLSDGQDDNKGADLRCQQYIEQMNIQDTFVINTFGYGKEHDSVVMNNISNLKGGSFVFIENVEKASENFILAISGMLSIFAKNVVVRIKSVGLHKISHVFGGDLLWNKIDEDTYEMHINYLLEGHQVKDFVFEMSITTENEKSLVLKSMISGELIKLKMQVQKDEELVILFDEAIEQVNENVEINYLRAKAGDCIGEAQKLANSKKYDEAIQLINKIMDEINESNYKDQQKLQIVLQDLKQIKQICTPQQYQQQGQALMLNKQKNHLKQQKSLNNSQEWGSDEEEQMDNFRNGNLQLSVCDMADNYQNDAFDIDNQSPQQLSPQLQQQLSPQLQQFRRSFNSEEDSM